MNASKILINVTGGEPLLRKDLCEVMEYATNELNFHW
jgi:MoaA/NifB/PqqE/SkfB family radical SAM enzyme